MAQKIFAVHVNSMAEERTVSNFTWITPTCRARLSVASMTRMTQIRQFYKTERSSSKPPHVPRLKYAKAAEKMRRQQLDEFSTFQATEAQDSDSDDESKANLNPGAQTIQKDSSLKALEESFVNFNCKLLPEILSSESESEDSANNDKSEKSSPSTSTLVSNPNFQDNDFTFMM